MKRLVLFLVTITAGLLWWQVGALGAAPEPIYLSPRPQAEMVQRESSIVMRFAEEVDGSTLMNSPLEVTGSISNDHEGSMILARDKRTIIFEPREHFTAGETVTVHLNPGLFTNDEQRLAVDDFSFTVSPLHKTIDEPASLLPPRELIREREVGEELSFIPSPDNPYVTVPTSFPKFTIPVTANGTDAGYVFISNFVVDWRDRGVTSSRPFLLILDNIGEPVFYRAMQPGRPSMDFKKQPNGLLTFGEWAGIFYGIDSSYNIVKTYQAKNGYRTDIHDLQILPDDHVLIMIYDIQEMDMTAYGGLPNAQVTGLVIQEQDSDGNVVFQWRSWDHFEFEESAVDLTRANIDYVHGNSFELDSDGNLIISSRGMDEVTKIDRQTGEIIWRLGGKANQFTFVNDPEPFFSQHDARRLDNGNITIFDNHAGPGSTYARAVEYKLDVPNMTATLVWEYRSGAMSQAMGNVQRLPNGNTMIGWGTLYPSLTEVKPNGEIAFELSLDPPDDPNQVRNSYRAFRFEWEGAPRYKPVLVARNETPGMTSLYTSWNGATNVSAYRVYGGETADNLELLRTEDKASFETKILIADAAEKQCYFRTLPLDGKGQPMMYSNLALAEHCVAGQVYSPINLASRSMN